MTNVTTAASIPQALTAGANVTQQLEKIWRVTASETETFSPLTSAELLARFAWSRVTEPGDFVAGTLIRALGVVDSLTALITGTPDDLPKTITVDGTDLTRQQLGRCFEKWRRRLSRSDTESDVRVACASQVGVLLPGTPQWPVALDDLGSHAPVMLWTKGNHRSFRDQGLSVVGARAVTSYGAEVTSELVQGAVELGACVISGAALGVDAIAHRTTLMLGAPTVAVLAGGIDRCYPAAHADLLSEIADNGLVCAENAPGTAPTRWRFLMRNRLIAALSNATLVTEAGKRSGSLNTAGHAAQLGRSLGAVPGRITSPNSFGCHFLLREYNADVITGAHDLPMLMGVSSDVSQRNTDVMQENMSGTESRQLSLHARVVDALPLKGRRSTSGIAKHAGLTSREALHALTELEVLGSVTSIRHPTRGKEWGIARSLMKTI